MSLDPNERLEALRREVLGEAEPSVEEPRSTAPAPVTGPASGSTGPGPSADTAPTARSRSTGAPASTVDAATSIPGPAAPRTTGPPASTVDAATSIPGTAAPRTPGSSTASDSTDAEGFVAELRERLSGVDLIVWLGIGLLGVGAYLLLSRFVPGIGLLGSIVVLGIGVVLLFQHFVAGVGSWALYAGAILTGIGGARLVTDILPLPDQGLTSIGIGIAFLAIGYLRHSQAGGYGWQGAVGIAALAFGGLQFALGMLPGSPGLLDLIVPVILLAVGGLIVLRALRPRPAPAAGRE